MFISSILCLPSPDLPNHHHHLLLFLFLHHHLLSYFTISILQWAATSWISTWRENTNAFQLRAVSLTSLLSSSIQTQTRIQAKAQASRGFILISEQDQYLRRCCASDTLPYSWYSAFVIHSCWNDPQMLRIDPPSHEAWCRSAGELATTLTCQGRSVGERLN